MHTLLAITYSGRTPRVYTNTFHGLRIPAAFLWQACGHALYTKCMWRPRQKDVVLCLLQLLCMLFINDINLSLSSFRAAGCVIPEQSSTSFLPPLALLGRLQFSDARECSPSWHSSHGTACLVSTSGQWALDSAVARSFWGLAFGHTILSKAGCLG